MKLNTCQSSDTWNLEVTPRFLEYFLDPRQQIASIQYHIHLLCLPMCSYSYKLIMLMVSANYRYWPKIDNALRSAAIDRHVQVRLLISNWKHTHQAARYFLQSLIDINGAYRGVVVDVVSKTYGVMWCDQLHEIIVVMAHIFNWISRCDTKKQSSD